MSSTTVTQTQAGGGAERREPERAPRTIDRYEIRGELGRGGVGVVYDAWDPQLERAVALKTLIAGRDATDTQIERFLREVRATARLRHPNVVRVHDAGTEDGRFYLAMDRIQGVPLDEVLEQRGPLRPRDAVKLLQPIARALAHAHREGFVHRDVKPENLLVDGEGTAYLTDFGLALDLAEHERLTRTDQALGTPAFMAPEQLRGRSTDPRVDVYALGATLYEALTGRTPFQAETFAELVDAALHRDPIGLRQVDPTIAPDLAAIVGRCLEKDPALRYPTADDLARDLQRFLDGEAVTARGPSLLRRARRLARRYRAVALGAAVALLGLAGGATYAVWIGDEFGAALRQKANLEEERARLLQARREALARFAREAARRDAFVEAALATDTEGEIAAYDALLSAAPDTLEARVLRARLLRRLGQERRARGQDLPGARAAFQRALVDLDQALRHAERPEPLVLLKAELLRADLRDEAAALAAYRELAAGPADDPLAGYGRGRIALAAGQAAEARQAAALALAARPALAPARLLLAESLLATAPVAAVEALDLLAGNPAAGAEALRLRGEALLAQGAAGPAEQDGLRAREIDPTDPRTAALVVEARLATKRAAHALVAARRGLDAAGGHPRLHLLAALAQARLAPPDLVGCLEAVAAARALGVGDELEPLLARVRAAVLATGRPLAERDRILLGIPPRAP